jgi:hypothetical protein
MKSTIGLKCYKNNNLVIRWKDSINKKFYSQGKRLPRNFPLSLEGRKIYVKYGMIKLVKFLKDRDCSSLREAIDLAHILIGPNRV